MKVLTLNQLRIRQLPLLLAVSLAWPVVATAQTKPPVPSKNAPAEEPGVKTDNDGTTVVGDRESPIGLYITPWRNDAPEVALDRPARFLEEQLLPLDAEVFRRQVEYFNTITAHLAGRSSGTLPKVK